MGRDNLPALRGPLLVVLTLDLRSVYDFAYKYHKLLVELQSRAGLPRNDILLVAGLSALAFFWRRVYDSG